MNKKQLQILLLPYGLRAVSGCDHEKFVGGLPNINLLLQERTLCGIS